jgi:hypothetical protein
MPITAEQLTALEQHRKNLLATVQAGISDEYLLATYNRVLRILDARLPRIQTLVNTGTLKQERRTVVNQARQGLGKNGTSPQGKPQATPANNP